MFLKMILTRCYNYIIKHLEKSKCFFRARKGLKMKVKELCEVIEKESYVTVEHHGKQLEGDYPCCFLDCELEVKRVSVIIGDVILIET